MSENIIFCFSGSGNGLDIAKNIGKELGDTEIVMMRKQPKVRSCQNAKTVGFVFPCYGGGAPVDFLEYVKMLSIPFTAYTYGVVTCAAYPGVGLRKLDEIVPLNYWATISHNCSCIWLFPHKLMIPAMSTKKAQARSEQLAHEVALAVKNRELKDKDTPFNVVNDGESKVFAKLAGKKAGSFSVSDSCVSCGQCEKICPRGNIKLVDGKPSFGSNCLGCLSCLQYCPTKAISIGKASENRERYHNPNVSANELMEQVIYIK